jgi:hypothetical protein
MSSEEALADDSDACEEAWIRLPARAAIQPAGHPANILLRRRPDFSSERLVAALKELDEALEEGMRPIDSNVPCESCGEIDVIAIDSIEQLTIIDCDATPGDDLLVRGMGHFDWAVRNLGILRRMYAGKAIDFSLPPRLILVAPHFSTVLNRIARHITRPQIDWVRYHVVDTAGGTGILFEHVVQK